MSPDEALEKVEAILEWASERPDFDTDFIDSLYERLEKGFSLTDGQETALENIIEKWGIEC